MKEAELKLKREQLIFEKNRYDKDYERSLDEKELKNKELNLKEEEIKANKKKMIIENCVKGGTVVLGAGLTWLAVCVGNEGILNKTAVSICDALVMRKA